MQLVANLATIFGLPARVGLSQGRLRPAGLVSLPAKATPLVGEWANPDRMRLLSLRERGVQPAGDGRARVRARAGGVRGVPGFSLPQVGGAFARPRVGRGLLLQLATVDFPPFARPRVGRGVGEYTI